MGFRQYCYLLLLPLMLCVAKGTLQARTLYGYNISEKILTEKAKGKVQNELLQHPMLSSKVRIIAIEKPHYFHDRSLDFLLIVLLITFVGIFRAVNPSYFRNLFRAFRNPTLSTRQLKDQLRQNSAASLAMDLVFCFSLGLYLYFALQHIYVGKIKFDYPQILLLPAFIVLFMLIYAVRFLFLKFTGWVFNIEEITDNYTFNVFLINKILGMALIPFTIILAFGKGPWVQAGFFLSFVVIAILLLNRYLRSGVVFGYFIKFSKFHFFMYLCASELLPLAVLMKWVNQWLIS